MSKFWRCYEKKPVRAHIANDDAINETLPKNNSPQYSSKRDSRELKERRYMEFVKSKFDYEESKSQAPEKNSKKYRSVSETWKETKAKA